MAATEKCLYNITSQDNFTKVLTAIITHYGRGNEN